MNEQIRNPNREIETIKKESNGSSGTEKYST